MFNSLLNKISAILIIVLIIALIGFAIKFKSVRKLFLSIVVIIIYGVTMMNGVQIYKYINASGVVFGELEENQTSEVSIQDLKFDFSDIVLTQSEGDTYSAKFESGEVISLEENQNFLMTVNDAPCSFVESSSDYIITKFKYSFLNDSLEEILSDELTFKFSFFKKSSVLTVSTSGGTEAVNLWNYYFSKNDFIVKIEPTDSKYYKINETFTVRLYYENYSGEQFIELKLKKGHTLYLTNDLIPANRLPKEIYGWKYNGEKITKIENIDKDYNIYAVHEKVVEY